MNSKIKQTNDILRTIEKKSPILVFLSIKFGRCVTRNHKIKKYIFFIYIDSFKISMKFYF